MRSLSIATPKVNWTNRGARSSYTANAPEHEQRHQNQSENATESGAALTAMGGISAAAECWTISRIALMGPFRRGRRWRHRVKRHRNIALSQF
jgi:hypothetical protein